MSSVFRYYENPPIHQVGDTKTSAMFFDHAGWLLCDGRMLDKQYYNNLFNIIGTAFGESEDGSQFAIPNPAGRVPAIVGQADPSMNTWKMGDICGEEMHTLTIAEMPAHKHGSTDVTGITNGNGAVGGDGTHAHTYSTYANADRGYTAVTENDGVLGGTQSLAVSGTGAHSHTIGSTGGNQEHNNIQPTIWIGHMFMYGGF